MLSVLWISLAATDVLLGALPLGVFWVFFAFAFLTEGSAGKASPKIRLDTKRLAAVCGLMVASALFNLTASKPSSLAYSALFAGYAFWVIQRQDRFSRPTLVRALKCVIALYLASAMANLVLNQLGVVDANAFLLTRAAIDLNAGRVRPQGLSSEPSYAAFIVFIAWLGLVRLRALHVRRGLVFLAWAAAVTSSLVFFQSVYGLILFLVMLSVPFERFIRRYVLVFLAVLLLLIVLASGLQNSSSDYRVFRILAGVYSGELDGWLAEDGSSFFRFGPLIIYLQNANFLDLQIWLGHGAASSSVYFGELFGFHAGKDVETMQLGVLPGYLYDYGIIPFLAFMVFLFKACAGRHVWQARLMVALMLFNANFNTQIIWYAVTVLLLSTVPPPRVGRKRVNEAA